MGFRGILGLLIVVWSVQGAAKVKAVIGGVAISRNVNVAAVLPEAKGDEILISRPQYVISYNTERRSPNWVAWRLEDSDVGPLTRSGTFQSDPDLEKYFTKSGEASAPVGQGEFARTCLDRGHQVPSKDRTDSVKNNEATFYMTNVLPQTRFMNRVLWEHLEKYTRDLVKKEGKKVYVVSGPIYDQDFGKIGPQQDIPVPSKFFKILYIYDRNTNPATNPGARDVIAAVFPNTNSDGSRPLLTKVCEEIDIADGLGTKDDWMQFRTQPKDLETLSGLSFKPRP